MTTNEVWVPNGDGSDSLVINGQKFIRRWPCLWYDITEDERHHYVTGDDVTVEQIRVSQKLLLKELGVILDEKLSDIPKGQLVQLQLKIATSDAE